MFVTVNDRISEEMFVFMSEILNLMSHSTPETSGWPSEPPQHWFTTSWTGQIRTRVHTLSQIHPIKSIFSSIISTAQAPSHLGPLETDLQPPWRTADLYIDCSVDLTARPSASTLHNVISHIRHLHGLRSAQLFKTKPGGRTTCTTRR